MLRLVGYALALLMVAGCGPKEFVCSESLAYGSAKSIIEKQLAAPATAKFARPSDQGVKVRKTGACVYRVDSFVDSQNGFGAMLRTHFSITVTGIPAEQVWQGSNLTMK
ncbi:hypothetical protein RHP75_15730 [Pseudomonas sp. SG20056]|uniref:hypothetical protein n=1 Tax=Pseudomonas sp. SG20056 TaxID=3074146 RepID=UPI00287F9E4D|nr:hypothetical protein [Pseudomonas sp. SG20056]WNF45815.1 hypothetical protein RHP75_15730 [Pseudomonas sp. SG20056]